jgi:protein phosphatase-4 regulatory subunit 3
VQKADAHGLVVISEEPDGNTLLIHRISKEDIYNRTGGMCMFPAISDLQWSIDQQPFLNAEMTIINWHDPDVNTDVAISFQEQNGCEHIW